jgi:hypothetical protein
MGCINDRVNLKDSNSYEELYEKIEQYDKDIDKEKNYLINVEEDKKTQIEKDHLKVYLKWCKWDYEILKDKEFNKTICEKAHELYEIFLGEKKGNDSEKADKLNSEIKNLEVQLKFIEKKK